MACGAHWEWRGFGGVNGTFADRFSNLEKIIDEHRQSDFYVYVQRLNTNLKVRQGEENELKFKRPDIFAGNFEMWSEQEDELFDFPLSKEGRSMLKKTLNTTELSAVGSIPTLNDTKDTLSWLKEIGCQVVEVEKTREIREWGNSGGRILVDWSCIHKPQAINSISLESESFEESDEQGNSKALKQIESALDYFQLDLLPLHPMNYLDAIAIWAKNDKI